MAERWTARQSVDLARGTTDPHVWRNMLLKPGDDRSLEWIIAVNQDGQPADLAGLEAAGYFLREDGVAVRCEGAIAGNVITVVATQSCYNVPGMLVGQVRLANADGSLAVAEGVFTVGDRLPDDPIQDGDAIPGLDALRAMITEMEGAAGEARAARDAANAAAGDANDAATRAEDVIDKALELDDRTIELKERADQTDIALSETVNGAFTENGYLYLTHDGEVVAGPLGPFSGGGGGGGEGNNAVITVTNVSGWLNRTIALGAECLAEVEWSSLEDEIPTGNGVLTVSVNGSARETREVAQGRLSIDLGPWMAAGSNTAKVRLQDVYGNARTVNFTVRAVAVSMESDFDDARAYAGEIPFTYTPTGSVEKTVHFEIDGTEIGTQTVMTTGRQQTYVIPAQAHGAHVLEAWFGCVIDGEAVKSNTLRYALICTSEGESAPIIASAFNQAAAEQYMGIVIPYSVYTPGTLVSAVTLVANGETVNTLTVDRTRQQWAYRPDDVGTLTLEIQSGTAVKRFSLEITETSIHVAPVEDDLALYLTGYGRSNREADPSAWDYGDIHAELTGFNWVSDGWQADEDGFTALRVSGDARVLIPYKPFERDFRGTGKTIEVEFATRNVLDYDAVVVNCISGGRGLQLTAQRAALRSEQSELIAQYKEDEHVRLTIVVEKQSEHRLMYIYLNGVMSGVLQYPAADDFSQVDPVGLAIGSAGCAVDVYAIRVYDNDLTRHQVLENWIADTQQVDARLARYRHNDVYDEYGAVVIDKLPNDLPYLVIRASELPQYKGDKKTLSGRYVNPAAPEKNFTFDGAQGDVQGTSSQYYARKNYKIKFKGGFTLPNGTNAKNYQLADGEIPVNVFTFKADVASSEGANNVELARLYNAACPYKTPAQEADSRVMQGIDGYPCVIFWDNGTDTVFLGKYNFNIDKGAEEFFGFRTGDESWEIKNNTSNRVLWKSADYDGAAWLNDFEARYPDTDPPYVDPSQLREFAEWIVQTDTTRATGDALPEPVTYTVDVTEIVEHVDPDTGAITYEEVTTKQDVTFTEDTAQYRLAKFREELERYVELDSALFYYLFTELFLMVDSRAKNAFPSFMGAELIGG